MLKEILLVLWFFFTYQKTIVKNDQKQWECLRSINIQNNFLDFSCSRFVIASLIGYSVCYIAIFLKFPRLYDIYKDRTTTKNINFKSIMCETLTNITLASFSIYKQKYFSNFGQHLILLGQNALIICLCMAFPTKQNPAFKFFIGLATAYVIAIIYFFSTIQRVFLQSSPFVGLAIICYQKIPQIYRIINQKKKQHIHLVSIYIAVYVNSFRSVSLFILQNPDIRPYLTNIIPALFNIIILFLYHFHV